MVVRSQSGAPVVPAWFVEQQLTRRCVGTAARCLARDFPLPDLLDRAYADCNTTFLVRVGGHLSAWVRGAERSRAGEDDDCPPPI